MEESIPSHQHHHATGTSMSNTSRADGKSSMNEREWADGAYINSAEHLSLVRFANRLGSTMGDKEAGIANERDVRREARLLMSLSFSAPPTTSHQSGIGSTTSSTSTSGRATPESDATSGYASSSSFSSAGTRRESFNFTCPSLSLDNSSETSLSPSSSAGSNDDSSHHKPTSALVSSSSPETLLGRPLKVDDRDALRLSAKAMSRNLMQSYQRGMEWRIKSWVALLSRRLVSLEQKMKAANATPNEIRSLLKTGEAKLVLHLQNLLKVGRVVDASTCFKVQGRVKQEAHDSAPQAKRQRTSKQTQSSEPSALAESEYTYDVAHDLSFECGLNITTPAGNVHIELELPGTMKGTFTSGQSGYGDLSGVTIDLNTAMLASMIEKSCRTVVRTSVEALLKSEPRPKSATKRPVPATKESAMAVPAKPQPTKAAAMFPRRTTTPMRTITDDRVQAVSIITPRDSSSPVYATDSDPEDRSVMLPFPSNFDGKQDLASGLRMLSSNNAKRRRDANMPSTTRFITRRTPTLISPPVGVKPYIEADGNGPNLPTLVEVACAAMRSD